MTVALGPLALDAYLPAFPSIADGFGIPHADVGLTLSAYVATLGLAQLVGGPLSDRYGRRNILFAGLAVFAIASLMVALADNLTSMIAWRDRKSTRLNSSHVRISYAVFCLKKKMK